MIHTFLEAGLNLHEQGFDKNVSQTQLSKLLRKAFIDMRVRDVEIMFEEFFANIPHRK